MLEALTTAVAADRGAVLPTPEAGELLGAGPRDRGGRARTARRRARGARSGSRARSSALLGRAGLLGLPYPEEHGGGGQPYEVYLQVLEEIAAAWLAVGIGVSVHTLACYPVAAFGTDEQRER